MLGNSLPVRNSEDLVLRDVFDTFAKHSGLVHDVGDTRFRVQNVSIHGRVFTIFKRRFLTNWTTTKYSEKLLSFKNKNVFLPFLSTGLVDCFRFVSPLTFR